LPSGALAAHMASEPAAVGIVSDRTSFGFGFFFAA
jgi:hypothetical protein